MLIHFSSWKGSRVPKRENPWYLCGGWTPISIGLVLVSRLASTEYSFPLSPPLVSVREEEEGSLK